MITWGYGLYRIAFLYPVLYFRPDLFELFALSEAPSKFGWAFIGVAFTAILFAPIAEELMYRGFLLNLWIPRHGLWVGIIASSVVFGVLHWERTLFATVMGVALALIYLRYDSLWPGIVIHGVYNFLCFNWSLGAIVGVKDRATVADPMNWIVEIILTALFLPAAWQFWRRFRPRPS